MKYIFIVFILFFIGCSQKEDIYLPNHNQPSTTHISKLKPYKVLGEWYYPRYVNKGEIFRGVASWYGPDFHGKLTANGEIYNMYDYTAANKTMPLGTIVRVTNLNNNKSVIVRINDRGPFVKQRIIDLSYAAGKKIGIDKTGTAPVEIVVLKTVNNQKSVLKYKQKTKKNGKIKIQIGAFKNLSGAKIFKQEFSSFNKNVFIQKIGNKYKVFIGYFNSYKEANDFKQFNDIKGFIVK